METTTYYEPTAEDYRDYMLCLQERDTEEDKMADAAFSRGYDDRYSFNASAKANPYDLDSLQGQMWEKGRYTALESQQAFNWG